MNREEIYFGYYKFIMAGSYDVLDERRKEVVVNSLSGHSLPGTIIQEAETKEEYYKRITEEAHKLALLMTENHLKEFHFQGEPEDTERTLQGWHDYDQRVKSYER